MLIDFHTHFFPEKLAARTIEVLRENMRVRMDTDKTAEELFPVCTNATYDDTCRLIEESNIDYSVLLPIATNEKQSANVNNYAEKVNGGRIISFASVHPFQSDWEYVLEGLSDRGFKGIKLHPEFQQFYINSKEGMRVLKKADKLGMLIVIHAGMDPGFDPPYHCTPQMLSEVIKEVDPQKIIAAHMGGMRMWDEVERYLVGTDINMDTSYISNDIDFQQYKRIIESHGTDKIVFGSDCPWQDPRNTLNDLMSLGLSDEDMELITSGNALRLLAMQ